MTHLKRNPTPRTSIRKSRLRLLVVGVALVLTSCADSGPSTTVTQAAAPESMDGAIGRMPFSWYILRESELRGSIREAEGILIQQCMERAGFDFAPAEYQPDRDYLRNRYGLSDARDAAERGYLPIDADTTEPLEPPLPADPGLRAAFLATLRGTPEEQSAVEILDPVTGLAIATQVVFGGCLGEANTTLFGSSTAFVDYYARDFYLQQAIADAHSRAMTDSRVVAAQDAWSECMATNGHTYSFIYEPFNVPWPTPRPSQSEIATAVADVACKQHSEFIGITSSVEAELQQQFIDANPELLSSIRETIESLATELSNQ